MFNYYVALLFFTKQDIYLILRLCAKKPQLSNNSVAMKRKNIKKFETIIKIMINNYFLNLLLNKK